MSEQFRPEQLQHALTPHDVSIATFNAVATKVRTAASEEERATLDAFQSRIGRKQGEMDACARSHGRYRAEDQQELARLIAERDDVVAKLQRQYDIRVPMSRGEVDVTPADGFGWQPFGFANMLRVTGKRMAAEAAQMGGWAAYPQGKSERNIEDFFRYVQNHHPTYQTPAEVTTDAMVRDALYFLQKRALDHVVVTDERRRILGIISDVDLQRASKLDEEMEVGSLPMKAEVVSAPEDIALDEAISMMQSERIHFLPIVAKRKKSRQYLRWVLTRKVAEQRKEVRPHVDEEGRLATVLAISAQRAGWQMRVDHAMRNNVTAIILDSPRFDLGHEEWRERVTYAASQIVASKRRVRLIVGNVDNPDSVASIVATAMQAGMPAGDVIVKVGIGPGHACITREVEGVGVPQWTAVYECARAAERVGGHIWADGGIRTSGDLAKLLAAGASQGMIGSIAVPLVESPAVLQKDEQGIYGVNFGMASDVFAQLRQDVQNDPDALRYKGTFNEGLGHQKVYQKSGIGTVADFSLDTRRGLRGALAMVAAFTMQEFKAQAPFVLQYQTGYQEGLGKRVVS